MKMKKTRSKRRREKHYGQAISTAALKTKYKKNIFQHSATKSCLSLQKILQGTQKSLFLRKNTKAKRFKLH